MAKKDEKEKKTSKKSADKSTKKKLKAGVPEEVLNDLAIATDFLVTAKAGVRNLAVAITETATPDVKKLLRRELDNAIETHDKIAQYMIENELYHAYDLDEQFKHDLEKADIALKLAKKE